MVHRSHPSSNDDKNRVKYGELVILGNNGSLPQGDKGRRRSKLVLYKRSVPNGIKKSKHYVVKSPHASQAILDSTQHSISYTLSRNQAIIVEYMPDEDTDMFQIGRSSEAPIDFVVMDTIPGDKSCDGKVMASTISRFACRILADRNNPKISRIYAAGFDTSRNIFLGEKATKWQEGHDIDGLTTNGVLIMHPQGSFCGGDADTGIWKEVSVGGGVYTLRESRSAQQKGKAVEGASNILQDGTLIDLCGATLLWRSAEGLAKSPTREYLESLVDKVNAERPTCPVGLNTLVIPRKSNNDSEKQPYVYLNCGHVQGLHDWGVEKGTNSRTCSMCFKILGERADTSRDVRFRFILPFLRDTPGRPSGLREANFQLNCLKKKHELKRNAQQEKWCFQRICVDINTWKRPVSQSFGWRQSDQQQFVSTGQEFYQNFRRKAKEKSLKKAMAASTPKSSTSKHVMKTMPDLEGNSDLDLGKHVDLVTPILESTFDELCNHYAESLELLRQFRADVPKFSVTCNLKSITDNIKKVLDASRAEFWAAENRLVDKITRLSLELSKLTQNGDDPTGGPDNIVENPKSRKKPANGEDQPVQNGDEETSGRVNSLSADMFESSAGPEEKNDRAEVAPSTTDSPATDSPRPILRLKPLAELIDPSKAKAFASSTPKTVKKEPKRESGKSAAANMFPKITESYCVISDDEDLFPKNEPGKSAESSQPTSVKLNSPEQETSLPEQETSLPEHSEKANTDDDSDAKVGDPGDKHDSGSRSDSSTSSSDPRTYSSTSSVKSSSGDDSEKQPVKQSKKKSKSEKEGLEDFYDPEDKEERENKTDEEEVEGSDSDEVGKVGDKKNLTLSASKKKSKDSERPTKRYHKDKLLSMKLDSDTEDELDEMAEKYQKKRLAEKEEKKNKKSSSEEDTPVVKPKPKAASKKKPMKKFFSDSESLPEDLGSESDSKEKKSVKSSDEDSDKDVSKKKKKKKKATSTSGSDSSETFKTPSKSSNRWL
ncbi:unnamed protein product [Nesidiocoris tenuis]|uniref:Protein pellino n=1 Tax=Nesidiocoris tenuis TaxID=355587 RepID=A0A6H5G9Q8_9HEMI|nr:unnamed protein product [Nesidiocoris tenuis]